MPELPQHTDESSGAGAKRDVHWDAVAAIIASLVGLLALVVAGYTAHIQRQQVSAQVWPYLMGGNSGSKNALIWINKGVGPAIVRNVEVTIDGEPQRDWKSVLRSLGLQSIDYRQSFLSGNVVSPGETILWIQFNTQTDYERFRSFQQRPDFRIEVCYCSTLDECWQTGFGGIERRPLEQCPVLPEAGQFRD
jgi:hypothetical protein